MWKLFLFLICATSIYAESPDEIIKQADAVRNPGESYFLEAEVTSNNASEPHLFRIAIQGNTKTRIETAKPERDQGRNMLMQDENMWVFIPRLKREVRVSLNQKLVGEAANGDISRMQWSGDYNASLESENEKEWILLLQANKKGLTYDRLRVWIEKGSFHPTKAEYMTQGGKVLKNATYTSYISLAGKIRPSQIIIQDAVRPSEQSTITIKQMKVQNFPSPIFQKTELGNNKLK